MRRVNSKDCYIIFSAISMLLWIGCERGVDIAPVPPAVTSEAAGVAEASAIPNITSSIFQDQSFECLNEVYNTSQNAKQSAPFQKDFEKCRFLAVIAEEFLGGKATNRGHVFSGEALENPASDTFGEYRNEVINPNTAANSDLSASQRAQSDLSGRCSATTEEIKVKRIEPTPGALRIVPPGCKDAAGNQPEYAFTLIFCCPKDVPISTPAPSPSITPITSTTPVTFACRKATDRLKDSSISFPDDIDFFGFSRPGFFNQDLILSASGSEKDGNFVIEDKSAISSPTGVVIVFDDRLNITQIPTVSGNSVFAFTDGLPLSNNGQIIKSPGGEILPEKMVLLAPLLDGFQVHIPKTVLNSIPFRHLMVVANDQFLGIVQSIAIFCELAPASP